MEYNNNIIPFEKGRQRKKTQAQKGEMERSLAGGSALDIFALADEMFLYDVPTDWIEINDADDVCTEFLVKRPLLGEDEDGTYKSYEVRIYI